MRVIVHQNPLSLEMAQAARFALSSQLAEFSPL